MNVHVYQGMDVAGLKEVFEVGSGHLLEIVTLLQIVNDAPIENVQ